LDHHGGRDRAGAGTRARRGMTACPLRGRGPERACEFPESREFNREFPKAGRVERCRQRVGNAYSARDAEFPAAGAGNFAGASREFSRAGREFWPAEQESAPHPLVPLALRAPRRPQRPARVSPPRRSLAGRPSRQGVRRTREK
jgi:hypothetical protein